MEVWQKAESVDIIGPFEEHRVIIDGYEVPYLTATPLNGGRVQVSTDTGSSIEMSVADAEHVLPWVADCIASASGFVFRPKAGKQDEMFPKPLFRRMLCIVNAPAASPQEQT